MPQSRAVNRGWPVLSRVGSWLFQYGLWLVVFGALADRMIAHQSYDPMIFRYVGF